MAGWDWPPMSALGWDAALARGRASRGTECSGARGRTGQPNRSAAEEETRGGVPEPTHVWRADERGRGGAAQAGWPAQDGEDCREALPPLPASREALLVV